MEDLMGLLVETVENSIVLASKPLFLFKDVFLLGVRTAVFVTLAWLRLLKAIICFPVNMCLGIIHWTISLASLPFRILNAFQKEKVLEFHLHEMEIELQNIIGEKKEVYRQLEIAIKDLRFVETILIEIEEEHNKAIVKIELLKNELVEEQLENLSTHSQSISISYFMKEKSRREVMWMDLMIKWLSRIRHSWKHLTEHMGPNPCVEVLTALWS